MIVRAVVFLMMFMGCVSFVVSEEVRKFQYCASLIDGISGTVGDIQKRLIVGAKEEARKRMIEPVIKGLERKTKKTFWNDLMKSSIGFVKVTNPPPVFTNGKKFGYVCVEIAASVHEDDRKKLTPISLEATNYCWTNRELPQERIKEMVKKRAVVAVLRGHDDELGH